MGLTGVVGAVCSGLLNLPPWLLTLPSMFCIQGWDKYWICYKAGDKCCVPACANGWDECAEVELQVCVGGACCRLLQHEDMSVEDKPRLG